MTNFNMFNYATIAEAKYKIMRFINDTLSGTPIERTVNRPSFENPRPCFGFIWNSINHEVRTNKEYKVDYETKIYINRNKEWALKGGRKNYCALTDDEIEMYIRFVSEVAGERFSISYETYTEKNSSSNHFDGIIVNLKAKCVPFKHVMIICNMIRYMYEWPEAYNVKQMFAAYENKLFFEDFGQIFCLYESFMRNTYDQHISYAYLDGDNNNTPSFIPAYTTKELHDKLMNHNIGEDACQFLKFQRFAPVMLTVLTPKADMWKYSKSIEYRSDNYVNTDGAIDEELLRKVTSLYKYMIMNNSIKE